MSPTKNIMVEKVFVPYINEHTRVTNDTNSCLNHFFIKILTNISKLLNISPIILQSDITDHFPIIIKIANINHKCKENSQKITKTVYTNYDQLVTKIKSESWAE